MDKIEICKEIKQEVKVRYKPMTTELTKAGLLDKYKKISACASGNEGIGTEEAIKEFCELFSWELKIVKEYILKK